ncbi:lysophospholipase L1-like esterase [Rhodococcus wratislaviensis]|uniref:G-D-S-L family lipolytic protein n=1 Tax=Rhodococcus wratislaviensis TaxID=44752 RepID=A0AB38F8A4_RHOWR|nr:SGNH/GDSL hydrolase family protein [Rhodococcus wratislaviensis]REE73017.1 lysophospholipase L1-like esterase [Rhodococcus wratislaviensis]SPZ37807.1 G-D-S-L family lipolytic protein [Rhodococcus wratislaviensis]
MSKKSRSRTVEKRDPKTIMFWSFMAVALVTGVAMYGVAQSRVSAVPPDEGRTATRSFESHTYPRLTVLGDSITGGSHNNVVWPDLLAAKRTWYVNNIAEGSTGYSAGENKAFPFKVDDAVATTPDVIMVVGSRNDVYNPELVGPAAARVYADLKAKAPNVPIFVVGPIWDNKQPPPAMLSVNASIRQAAQNAGLLFIDALAENWLGDPTLIQKDDRVHPTDAGQQVLADHIDRAIPQVTIKKS